VHLTGAHLAELLGHEPTTRLRTVLGTDLADIVCEWHRETLDHGHHGLDTDPLAQDVLAVPVALVATPLTDHGVEVPTVAQCRAWANADRANAGDGIDPEIELLRARYTTDPDLFEATTGDDERRICGVPESIYSTLAPADQAKVRAGKVIAGPQAPTFVASWLARHVFTVRQQVPGAKRRHRAWMRTLVRIDGVFYAYERAAKGESARWVPHTDQEWMRARLRKKLRSLYYLKGRTEKGQTIHDQVKNWNPDTRTLALVEDALADAVNVGSGTAARELPDAYGDRCGAYPASGTWVQCRNGVLDVAAGRLVASCPLWFSPSRVEADYDPAADPHTAAAWFRVLEDQWADDPGAIACLQEWFGYALSGRMDLQKWMLIVGPSGSGKSIIAEVLGALMGAVTATRLDTLNSRFGLATMYDTGARLALLGDIRFSSRDSSTAVENMLTIIGQDDVTIDRKYRPEVTARLAVRFHGSANEMPRWSDDSNALQKRALLLETTVGYRDTDAEDPTLKGRVLADELGAVLRWAVRGLQRLNANGGKFTRSKRADELATELAETASPTLVFVRECCELGATTDYVTEAALFHVWGKWAVANNTGKGKGKEAFKRSLKALPGMDIRPGQLGRNESRTRVIRGIKAASVTYMARDNRGNEYAETATAAGYEKTVSDTHHASYMSGNVVQMRGNKTGR
jgi:putative DNA primase/helicase